MSGTLAIVGVGPGDPELLTVKAARRIAAAPVVAYFAKGGRPSHARCVAGGYIRADAVELRFDYPFTTEKSAGTSEYVEGMQGFYAECARGLGEQLDRGRDVALLCEGDPFFYGSSMYMFDRHIGRHRVEVIPGVTGMSGCWTRAGVPMLHGDDTLSVIPGTLAVEAIADRLARSDAAVVMKLGRNLPKVRAALDAAGRTERAVYVERGTMPGERVLPVATLTDDAAPYFSLVLVPGRERAR